MNARIKKLFSVFSVVSIVLQFSFLNVLLAQAADSYATSGSDSYIGKWIEVDRTASSAITYPGPSCANNRAPATIVVSGGQNMNTSSPDYGWCFNQRVLRVSQNTTPIRISNLNLRTNVNGSAYRINVIARTLSGGTGSYQVRLEDTQGNLGPGSLSSSLYTQNNSQQYLFTQSASSAAFSLGANDDKKYDIVIAGTSSQPIDLGAIQIEIINNAGFGPGVLGNPASIVLSSAPQNFQAGNNTSMTFQVNDQYGNMVTSDNSTQVTLNVTESSANNSASSTSTQTVSNGTVTFNITDTQVETLSFSVSNNASATNPSVNNVNVLPGNGNTLTLTQAPANFVAGNSTTLQFKIYDAYNNLVTTDNTTQLSLNITESSPDNSSSVTSPITVSGGIGSFTVSDNDVETLSFTVSANPSLSVPAINNITVSAASLSALQVSGISNPITAGAFSNVIVTAVDAFGNLISSYTGTVNFTSSDALATLPSNYTFTAADQGDVIIYNGVKFLTSGNKSVTATDIVNPSLTGSQTVAVTSGSAVALQVTGISNPFSSGAVSTVTVRAVDSFGNTATSYTGTVMFSSTDTGATLPSNYTFTAADQGQVTLGGLTLVSMGFQTVTVTDIVNSSITGSQNSIDVVTGTLVAFEVTGITSPIAVGTSSGVSIRAIDAGNNTVTSFTGTVIFSSTDASATFVDLNGLFPGQFTFTAVNQGQVTLPNEIVFATPGNQSVTVTQFSATITGTQLNITVYTSIGNNLALTSAPSNFTVGGSTTLTFQVQDQYNTLIASDNSTQLTLTVIEGNVNGSAVVSPGVTITVSGGIGTFTVSDTEAETLAFTISSSPALNYPTINQITVNPAIASQIVMITAPVNFAAGSSTNLVFQIQDQYGNLLSSDNSTQLTLALTEGNANSSGSILPSATVTVTSGQASFLVGDTQPETLDFTLSNNIGVSNPTINQVIVSTGNADHIAITTQPSNFTAGGSTTLVFQVQDVNNNVITSDNTTVLILSLTESIVNGSSTLTTNPLVVSSGVGSFTVGDTQVETLSFTVANSQGLTNPTINNVSVTTGAADHLFISTQPSNFIAGGSTSMIFQVQDASNNIITSDNSTQIILSITEGNPNSSASITVNPVTVSGGVGSFTVSDSQVETLNFTVINTAGITNPAINQINVSAAPGTQIVLSFAPTNFTAGGNTSMTFQVQDQFGNTVTSDNSTVLTLSILEGNVDGSASVTTINPVTVSAGVGSFTVTDNDAETLDFTLTSVPVLTVPTINQITVNPGVSDHIALTNAPINFAAGTSTIMTFEIQDVYNNLVTTNNSTTITLLMSESIPNSSSALIPVQSLPYTKTVSGGLTSFTVTDTQVETLSFFIVSNPALTYPVVPSVNVTQAPASQLVMTSAPNNFIAGSNTTMTFEVQDQYGNLVASDNSTVLSLTVTEGDVNSSVVVTPGTVFTVTNGVLTFQIDDTDAEILNFSITSLPLLTLPTINQITVSPATADHLALTTAPANFVAGANTTLIFQVQDIYNNLVTTDNSTILNLSLIEGIVDGTSSIAVNPITVSSGIGTLSVSDTQVETLDFTIISNPALLYPVINQVNVLPAPASQLVMTSAPADFTAGTNTTVTFEVQDQYGNIITSDNTTNVTLSITEGDVNSSVVVAPGITATVTAGIVTFTISDIDAETVDFVVTTNNAGITTLPTINQIIVSPATADHLTLTNAPSNFIAGLNTTATFEVQDIYNNLLTADNVTQITLNITESIPDGTSNIAVNPVTVSSGIGTFTVTDTQVETLSFNVISVPALSYPVIPSINVLISISTDLVMTLSPADFIAGSTTTLTFQVQDAYGNVDTSNNSTQVTLGVLEGIVNTTATINGVFTNPLMAVVSSGVITFTVGDTQVETLDFTVTNNASLNNPVVPQINVLIGAADHLALTTVPSNFVAGANTTLTFQVQDQYNNILIADNTTQITLAVTESIPNASSSVLPGTTITVANGIGSFTVSDTQVETLSFSVNSVPALSYPVIPSVNVTIAVPSDLVMTLAPADFVAGSTTTVTFKVEDQYGNINTADNSTQVTLSVLEGISNGTATINGGFINPLTLTVSNGSVTFILSDTEAETLNFVVTNSGTLSNPVVPQITVTAGVHSGYAISILFPPAQQNVPATFTVRAVDQYNNTITNYLGTINFSSSATATLPANYTFLPSDNGQQSFSGTFLVQGSQTLMILDISTFIFSALTHIVIDSAAPTVTLLNPLDNAVGVPTNVTLMMIFNEAVNVGSGNIEIRDSGTNNLIESIPVGSAQVTGGGSTTIFIDISSLALSTSYYVIVPNTAFQDLSANNFAGYLLPTDWNFTTNAVDITPPSIVTLSPADNSVGALVGTNLTMIFDEPVIAGAGSIQVYDDTAGGILVDIINVTSGNVTGTGTSIITIVLNISPLASNNNYHIIVPAGAFTDTSSNSYAGILTATGWNFTTQTLDVIPPSALTFFPADNAINVPIATNLVITFDEPVFGQAGNNIEIYTTVGNILVETIDAASASVSGNGTTTITIDITDLADDTGFYVLIDNGAFEDSSNNAFAGIASTTTWNFTTVDATLPSAISFSPLDNATNVLVGTNLVITFSEPVFSQAGNNIEIYTTVGNILVETIDAASAQVTGSGSAIITINPLTVLSQNTDYYILIDNGAFQDISANNYAGIASTVAWNFVTQDIAAPIITLLSPADNGTNVSLSSDLTITFNEIVTPILGQNIEVYTTVGNILVETINAGSAQVTGGGTNTITIDISNLSSDTGYYILIDAGAFEDSSNNAFAGIASTTTWNFTTVDVTSPTVNIFSPADNAVGVSATTNLVLTFNEVVNAVGGNNIQIFTTIGDVLIETIDAASAQVTGSGTSTITINPASVLSENTDYYVLIDVGAFEDSSNNAYAGIASTVAWNFVIIDTTAPFVTLFSPPDDGTNVSTTANLTMIFNEAVIPVSGQNIEVHLTVGGFLVETIDAGSAQVTGGGTNIINIDIANLFSNTGYYILIDAGAFEDSSNNAYAGIASTVAWNFTTVNTTAPQVNSFSPADNSTGIAITSDLVITFDQPVNVVAGQNIEVRLVVGGTLVESIDVGSAQVTGGGTATINIDIAPLSVDTAYYINIDPGAFESLAFVPYVGIADAVTWNFVTVDTLPPSITTFSPLDDSVGVSVNADLVMIFNEPVIGQAGQNIEVRLVVGGTLVESIDAASAQVTGSGTTTINVNIAPLTSDTAYYINIDAGAFKDISNNSHAGISSSTAWNFTTADITAPIVTIFLPADNASNVSTTANLVLTFNEVVNAVGGNNIEIRETVGGALIETIDAGSGLVTGSGTTTITINPVTVLTENTGYYILIDFGAFQDVSANNFAGIVGTTVWNFTTDDTTPPTVTTFSPLDDSVGVSVNADLVMIFNEPVIGQAGQNIEVRLVVGGTLVESIDAASAQVTGSGTNTITVNIAPLAISTAYYINIDAGAFEDTFSNPYAGISNTTDWNFATAASDTTPPTIITTNPLDDAIGVSGLTNLTITFDEAVNAVAGNNIYIRETVGDALVETINAGSAQVTGGGTSTITINPGTVLTNSTGYYILIDAGAFEDLVANDHLGIASKTVWNFTTGITDTTPPDIITYFPGTVGFTTMIPTDQEFGIVFSETMNISGPAFGYGTSGSDYISLVDQTSTLVPATISYTLGVGGGGFYSYFHINPTAALIDGVNYTLTVKNTITDLAGNPLNQMTNFVLTFQVDASLGYSGGGTMFAKIMESIIPVAHAAPVLTSPSLIPSNGTVEFDVNGVISITFQYAVIPTSMLVGVGVILPFPASMTFSSDFRTYTYTPTVVLADNVVYSIGITAAVADFNGDTLATPFTTYFATEDSLGGAESILTIPAAPNVAETSIVGSSVAYNGFIEVQFTESVDQTTVATDPTPSPSLQVLRNGTIATNGTLTRLNSTRYRFTPSSNFAQGTSYTLVVTTAVQDLDIPTASSLTPQYNQVFTTTTAPSGGGGGGGSADHRGGDRYNYNKVNNNPIDGLSSNIDVACDNTTFQNASDIFPDIFEISWVNPYVSALYNCGALQGNSKGLIRPWANGTRGELLSLVMKVNKVKVETGLPMPFPDVKKNSPYYNEIATAYKLGMVKGHLDGTFKENKQVTREEASKLLLNAAGFNAKTYTGTSKYKDTNPKSWSASYIAFLKEKNITDGYPDGSFKPYNWINRGELFKIIVRIAKLDKKWFPPLTNDASLVLQGN